MLNLVKERWFVSMLVYDDALLIDNSLVDILGSFDDDKNKEISLEDNVVLVAEECKYSVWNYDDFLFDDYSLSNIICALWSLNLVIKME